MIRIAAVECSAGGEPAGLAADAHALVVLPAARTLPADLPARALWLALLKRKRLKVADLAKTPLHADLPDGRHVALLMASGDITRFERLTRLRKALAPLLDEQPDVVAIHSVDAVWADDAVYVALINGLPLPTQKKENARPLTRVRLHSPLTARDLARTRALAAGNGLARSLTALPNNVLTPAEYRRRIRHLAKGAKLTVREFDLPTLRKMGAGAFCAVAQGSLNDDAAIVRVSYRPKGAAGGRQVALVGKGICFDTGGHNLKSARYMQAMHEDMGGSAVALALTLAAAERKLPVAIDCWLAIAHNHISPQAYAQSDIVTALNGTTIEVVHTDAEGRMVLADTLTLATRDKRAPDLVIDFATLTGAMVVALGTRYAGVFATDAALASHALEAGKSSGERVCVLPDDDDYDAALDSKVADVLQCTMDGEADHILAARFLRRFVGERPWLHVDLSTVSCKGGLGAVGSALTGFGVAWGSDLLDRWLAA